jgi:hypothetical protein
MGAHNSRCSHLRVERQEHMTAEELFKPRPGKRISSWLSIRHGRGGRLRGRTVFMTFRGILIPVSIEEAKRLRDWLDGVIP